MQSIPQIKQVDVRTRRGGWHEDTVPSLTMPLKSISVHTPSCLPPPSPVALMHISCTSLAHLFSHTSSLPPSDPTRDKPSNRATPTSHPSLLSPRYRNLQLEISFCTFPSDTCGLLGILLGVVAGRLALARVLVVVLLVDAGCLVWSQQVSGSSWTHIGRTRP